MFIFTQMAITLQYTYSQSNDCDTLYWQDTTANYGVDGNVAASAITSTKIILTDSSGNTLTYSDYLPTQGEIGLLYDNFTASNTTSTISDCGDCGSTTTPAPINFQDGCFSVTYQVFVDGVLLASAGSDGFFYCTIRNDIFALIVASCDDCCDADKQSEINRIKNDYDIMLITFNKNGCGGCVNGLLERLQKRVANFNNDCLGC